MKVTEKGLNFLDAPYPVTLSKDHDYSNVNGEEDDDDKDTVTTTSKAHDEVLFELLKALRKKVAKEKGLPPYVIFQDPSLEEMATTYPTTREELSQINGVGMGKVVKFGKPFIDLIAKYVEDNDIETASDVVVKSAVNKSKIKIFIIQQIDRKIDLDEISESKGISMAELLEEIEHICYSGTRLNLDYYISQIMDDERQDEIYEYFMNAETDNIQVAVDTLGDDEFSEEELRLMRIKFISEVAN
jgi:ATP-dependent DNA helicase RecQ